MSQPSTSGQPVAGAKWSSKEVSEYPARWGVEDAVQRLQQAQARPARDGARRVAVQAAEGFEELRADICAAQGGRRSRACQRRP